MPTRYLKHLERRAEPSISSRGTRRVACGHPLTAPFNSGPGAWLIPGREVRGTKGLCAWRVERSGVRVGIRLRCRVRLAVLNDHPCLSLHLPRATSPQHPATSTRRVFWIHPAREAVCSPPARPRASLDYKARLVRYLTTTVLLSAHYCGDEIKSQQKQLVTQSSLKDAIWEFNLQFAPMSPDCDRQTLREDARTNPPAMARRNQWPVDIAATTTWTTHS